MSFPGVFPGKPAWPGRATAATIRPPCRPPRVTRFTMESPMVVVRALVMAVVAGCAVMGGVADARPVVVRVQWGGGTPQAWGGTVEIVPDGAATPPRPSISWRTLSTDADGTISQYLWAFDSGPVALAPGAGSTFTQQFTVPGTYAVRLIVFDDSGVSAETTADIVVTP